MKKKLNRFERFSVFFTLFALYQVILRVVRRRWHFPAPTIIAVFLDSPIRRKLQPPVQVLERSGLSKGMKVLEIGCGSGIFIPTAARMVGELGHVHALDVQPKMLELLRLKLEQPENANLRNITIHQQDALALPFENGSLDLVYLCAALFEIPDLPAALAEIHRVLKPHGILAVTEFLPDPDYHLEGEVIRAATRGGFTYHTAAGNLLNYTVQFKKPAAN
ncbi:MAG: methyltransferase domain-containing protein [Anaerolineae bacterium]|nr:methyltransferase domain-containing protein [Anaerolineae bacterium]